MSRLRLVTNRFSVQRATETPAFDLPICPITQTNKIVAGEIGGSDRPSMSADVVGRRTHDPRKRTELANEVTGQP